MHDRTIFIFTIRTKPTENVVNFSRNEHSLDKPKTLVSTRLKVNPGRILCGRFEISLKLEGKNHTSTCKTYMTYKNTSISRFKMGLKCICIYDRKWNFNLCIRTFNIEAKSILSVSVNNTSVRHLYKICDIESRAQPDENVYVFTFASEILMLCIPTPVWYKHTVCEGAHKVP